MPVQRKNTDDLGRAIAKLKKASETNQGACLLRYEAAAIYEELLERKKQNDRTEGDTK
jgi:hypothetical protein